MAAVSIYSWNKLIPNSPGQVLDFSSTLVPVDNTCSEKDGFAWNVEKTKQNEDDITGKSCTATTVCSTDVTNTPVLKPPSVCSTDVVTITSISLIPPSGEKSKSLPLDYSLHSNKKNDSIDCSTDITQTIGKLDSSDYCSTSGIEGSVNPVFDKSYLDFSMDM